MSIFPSKVNYTTGEVLTATEMNEIGQAINLLDGAQWAAAKNRLLNSDYSVWQRGTSVSVAASASVFYTADRWCTTTGVGQASTVSRQATGDTTNLPNIRYCARFQRNAGQTGTGDIQLAQSIETANAIALAGKSVVFSFYARAGANYSASGNALKVYLITGTGTDQNALNGYTGAAYPINGSTATLTTTWQRFTFTATIAATATEIAADFLWSPIGTAGANDYFEVTGVQLEASSATVASQYAPNGATYAAEVAACQRYYYRTVVTTAVRIGAGYNTSTAGSAWVISFPVSMRTAPSALEVSGTAADYAVLHGNFTVTNCNAVPVFVAGTLVSGSCTATVASGLTAGQGSLLYANNSNAYLGWSAEL
jgi:hypothetical protein